MRPTSKRRLDRPALFFFRYMQSSATKQRRGRPAGAVQRLTVREVAALLSVPLQTVYTWTRQKTADDKPVLPTAKYGARVRILLTDVDALPARLAARAPASFFVEKEAA